MKGFQQLLLGLTLGLTLFLSSFTYSNTFQKMDIYRSKLGCMSCHLPQMNITDENWKKLHSKAKLKNKMKNSIKNNIE